MVIFSFDVSTFELDTYTYIYMTYIYDNILCLCVAEPMAVTFASGIGAGGKGGGAEGGCFYFLSGV